MEMLSSEYGWTPKEIRNQNVRDLLNYFDIMQIKAMLKENKIKQHK